MPAPVAVAAPAPVAVPVVVPATVPVVVPVAVPVVATAGRAVRGTAAGAFVGHKQYVVIPKLLVVVQRLLGGSYFARVHVVVVRRVILRTTGT